jgi:exopolyphosphatase/guanosine-5'-triphosphate,3'-diphosphate pyrophosphatase
VLATLDDYRADRSAHHAERASRSSPARCATAANGEPSSRTRSAGYGLDGAKILDGDEEARLTFLGATSERDPDDRTTTLVTDIGGGSTEFVIGRGGRSHFHVSTQAGVVRQTERHLHTTRRPEELDELAADVRSIIDAAVPEPSAGSWHAIGVAGTPTSLAAIAQALDPYDPDRVQGYSSNAPNASGCRSSSRLAAMPLEERREVPGLHPDRAPTIVAGAVILIEVMRLFALERIEVSEHDILRGAALTGPVAGPTTRGQCGLRSRPPHSTAAHPPGLQRTSYRRTSPDSSSMCAWISAS